VSLWPFKTKKQPESKPAMESVANSAPEISTMDRILTRNCSRDELFLLYSKLLQERFPKYSIEFTGESVLHITNPEGKELTTYLDNLWLRYKDGSEDRRDLIERFVRFAENIGVPALPVARENIVAIIKDAQYMEQFTKKRAVADHLCGDLWVVYAIDEPERTGVLMEEKLSGSGIAREDLRALAVSNLQRILPPVERHGGGPWYLLTAGQDYVASLLLFDWLWSQLADSVEGEIVAVAPSRDVVMYTGSKSPEGIAAIRGQAKKIEGTGPYAISTSLIVRRNGQWAPFHAN
jgi:uncharacterized protein YtpQ (UPF0354 family)